MHGHSLRAAAALGLAAILAGCATSSTPPPPRDGGSYLQTVPALQSINRMRSDSTR